MEVFLFGAVCGAIVSWAVTHLYHNAKFQDALKEETAKLNAAVREAKAAIKERL